MSKNDFLKWWQLFSSFFFLPIFPSLCPQSSLKWPPHWLCWLKVKPRTFGGCVERLKFTPAAHQTKTMADNSYSLQFPAVEPLTLCGCRWLRVNNVLFKQTLWRLLAEGKVNCILFPCRQVATDKPEIQFVSQVHSFTADEIVRQVYVGISSFHW